MAHGGPDWGTEGPVSTIHSIQDLGELAARLGSPVTFDRRGNVMWFDDFESGIGQWFRSGDAGYSVDWNSQYMQRGGFSCKLMTPTATGETVWLQKITTLPVISKFGLEITFSREQFWRYLDFGLVYYDGHHTYTTKIRLDVVNDKLQYWDEDGNWQDVPGGQYHFIVNEYFFHTLKYVINPTMTKYQRLIVSNQELDLSAINSQKAASATSPIMLTTIVLTSDSNLGAIGYIDDVIFTQNEP